MWVAVFRCGKSLACQQHNLQFLVGKTLGAFSEVKHISRFRYLHPGPLCFMSGDAGIKKARVMKKIGTHNGTFHCDEVVACYLLKLLPEFKDSEIIRTRDPTILETCDIVVDVGAVYDPSKHRYDHHQREFSESMSTLVSKKWTTKLSSAGLIFLHFGKQIVAQMIGSEHGDHITDVIFDKVYENFIEAIDAIDNGINQCENPRYFISTDLSSRVSYLNPKWNEVDVDVEAQFREAMNLVGAEFTDRVMYYKTSWLPARSLVKFAIESRKEVDPSGEIICLASGGCPWKDHLFALETEIHLSPVIKYVLFPDQVGQWRVQCVPEQLGSFSNRLSLQKNWCGVRDSKLSDVSGIAGCIFVHASGFIGGNKTYEGALTMAQKSLQQENGS